MDLNRTLTSIILNIGVIYTDWAKGGARVHKRRSHLIQGQKNILFILSSSPLQARCVSYCTLTSML
jgi:hypothetical protein